MGFNSTAQTDEITSEQKVYKNELGLDATILIGQFVKYSSSNPYLIIYRR